MQITGEVGVMEPYRLEERDRPVADPIAGEEVDPVRG
jgi:hypothetical protein